MKLRSGMAARFLTQSEMVSCSTASCSDMERASAEKYNAKCDNGRSGRERRDMELLGKSREELRALCVAMGEPAYRGDQLYRALYAEQNFALSRMTNLPAGFREKLVAETTVTLPTVRQRYVSADGSVRYLLGLDEEKRTNTEITECAEKTKASKGKKAAAVEAVFMPSEARQTICISTQAGC